MKEWDLLLYVNSLLYDINDIFIQLIGKAT